MPYGTPPRAQQLLEQIDAEHPCHLMLGCHLLLSAICLPGAIMGMT
jgi:hypothetical protein